MANYNSLSESPWYKLIHYGLEFFGRYYSNYRGFVIDNNDPQGLNRVKVVCPSLIPDDKGQWAFPKGQWGSNGFGVQILPKVGDMIFLEFDHGNLDYPIWSFAGYGENEKPEEFNKPEIIGMKTPSGHVVLIDDSDEWKIQIKSKTSSEYINIQEGLIETESEVIKLGKDGGFKAVKGETNNENLEAICDKLDKLVDIFATHSHPSNGAPPTQASEAINLKVEIQEIIQQLSQSLSDKVKLD